MGATSSSLTVAYSGRLDSQALDREAVNVSADGQEFKEFPVAEPEPRFIYSNRVFWYPQGQVTDYATATMRITVPETLGCVGSGVML